MKVCDDMISFELWFILVISILLILIFELFVILMILNRKRININVVLLLLFSIINFTLIILLNKGILLTNQVLIIIVLFELLVFIITLLITLKEYNLSQKQLSKFAIKEAIDNLDCGIAFFNKNGLVILINQKMIHLVNELMNSDLQNLNELEQALIMPPNQAIIKLEHDEIASYQFSDEKIWLFKKEVIYDLNDSLYTEVIALDITTLEKKKNELEQDSHQLAQTAQKLERLAKDVVKSSFEEEILKMKMKIHNDMGRSLLATRRILIENLENEEAKPIILLWKEALSLIRSDQEEIESKTMLAQLEKAAKNIGIELIINGSYPDNSKVSYLIDICIRECLTNAVYHAKATKIFINITLEGIKLTLKITNNGIIPETKIVEGGGLSTLRRKIEKNNGTMIINSDEKFELIMVINLEEGEDNV